MVCSVCQQYQGVSQMKQVIGILKDFLRYLLEWIGFLQPKDEFEAPITSSRMKALLVNAAVKIQGVGQLDETIFSSDVLELFAAVDPDASIKEWDLPIERVLGLKQRLFYKPGSKWRDAIEGLHCHGWDQQYNAVTNYFTSKLGGVGFPISSSSGPIRIYFVGNAAYCGLAAHRVAAARVLLAHHGQPYFKKVDCSLYSLKSWLKPIFESCLKNQHTIHYFWVPASYEDPNTESGNLKYREFRINNSNQFLKKKSIALILKTTDSRGNNNFYLLDSEGGQIDTIKPTRWFLGCDRRIYNMIVKRVPFTEIPRSVLNLLVSEPFVADRAVSKHSGVPHPNGLQRDVFGLIPEIKTSGLHFPKGMIYLPRGEFDKNNSGFGLEFIVAKHGKNLQPNVVSCVHTKAIQYVAELLSPGMPIHGNYYGRHPRTGNRLTIVNSSKGSAILELRQKGQNPPFYTVIRIFDKCQGKGAVIGRLLTS